jgi:hypothetical protein
MKSFLSEIGDLYAESSWTAAKVAKNHASDIACFWVAHANASCFLVLMTPLGTPATTE